MRRTIRLRESELRRMISESVRRIMLKESNDRTIRHICAGLVNGNIYSDVSFEEAWEGVFDMVVDMGSDGRIFATCEGEIGDSDFHLVSADITWQGSTMSIDENEPIANTLNRCLSLLVNKGDL